MINDVLNALRESQQRIEQELSWMGEAIRSNESAHARNAAALERIEGALERIPQSAAWEDDVEADAESEVCRYDVCPTGTHTLTREHRIEDDPVLEGARNYLGDKSEGRY